MFSLSFFYRDFVFSSSNEFVEHLATIRLDDERVHQYPPKAVMIEIARILFKSVFEKKKKTICSFFLIVVVIQALTSYEQNVKQTAASYEYYAMQYFQTAKADKPVVKSNEKLFFFYELPFQRDSAVMLTSYQLFIYIPSTFFFLLF